MSGRIVQVEVVPWSTPLPHAVRGVAERRGWWLRLTDETGRVGVGDAAPWPGRGGGERATAEALQKLTRGAGWRLDDPPRPTPPEAAHALDQACLDLLGQRRELSTAELLWPQPAATVPTCALVATPDEARAAIEASCRHLKVKLDHDLAPVAAIRDAVGPAITLRVDANGAWTTTEALRHLDRLAGLEVALVEQPVAPGDLGALRACRGAGVAIAVDEGITGAADLEAIIAAQAADVVVLKPMFLGGLRPARRLAERALEAGLEVLISSALESPVGQEGLLALAGGLPRTWPVGLGAPQGEAVVPVRGYPSPVESAARSRPDHPAIEADGHVLTYRQLADRVSRCAGALASAGVHPGQVVALDAPGDDLAEWAVHAHAVMWLGAVLAPLPPDPERALTALAPDHRIQPVPRSGPPHAERPWPLGEDRLVILTSGSTGAPRPIRLTTQQLVLSALGSATRLGLSPSDRWLGCLPLHHIGGLQVLLRSAVYGTTAVLHPRFDPATVAASDVTLTSWVPDMLRRTLEVGTPATLRAALVGGGPCPPDLAERAREAGVPIALTWGMTEAASQVATSYPGERDVVPLPAARVSATGGRLAITGPLVGGHLRTADTGEVGPAGVVVTGRADATIVSGGTNLDPVDIERALREHPAVRDALVVGLPDPRWGARPGAVVTTSTPLRPEDLAAWCRQTLPGPQRPDALLVVDALPRTALGKPDRATARTLLAGPMAWRRNR